ncbi:FkbM family methyltransferase [Tardiphaga sp.]|uniref:FkbM family methyltransferase n=1 Tax=Tardiphaga sp. TaxID=1926292 RepID=UPI002602F478|nr:FkbM family methyltransferase [Tardiphaga sp.]MDB5619758.1 methyltransferase FkbM [Tardiphaga sp.]
MSGTSMRESVKRKIRAVIPLPLILVVFNQLTSLKWRSRGFKISSDSSCYRIQKDQRQIRLAKSQAIYLNDTLEHFDFYFAGVEPIHANGMEIVDYSLPHWHVVKGFDLFPVYFPAVAEPMLTTAQYVEFAAFTPGSVVIDLGAYSGLTSIVFDQALHGDGRVIALEADKLNSAACKKNFALYTKFSGRTVDLVEAAVWRDNNGISFSSEGSMGSSAVDIVGTGRGEHTKVSSITLERLVQQFNLDRVDFIKCDIEGGEVAIFDQPEFFARFKPKIVIECHDLQGANTSTICEAVLGKFGYTFQLVEQHGYPLPLLMCTPGHG